jgi:hypothetical protein
MFLGLYNEGILLDPRGVGTLSTAIGDREIEMLLEGLRTVLTRLGSHDMAPASAAGTA